jgi:ribonuclease E
LVGGEVAETGNGRRRQPSREPALSYESEAERPSPEARSESAEKRSEPAPAEAAPRRRHEGSSEPRIERIVVGEARAEETETGAAEDAPARKGWWQRRLSGE